MKYLYIILLLLVALMSCNKDDAKPEVESPIDQIVNDTIVKDTTTTVIDAITDEEFAAANFGNTLVADFIGKIIDIDTKPLKDVQITIGDQTVLTDSNGVFVLNKVSVNEKFAFVKAQKTDYILGSRTIVPTTNGSNFINIILLKKNIVGTVDSGESSEIRLPNGARVNFAGSFIDTSGASYTGKVEVSMHYLEPNQNSTFTQMPGTLFGKRENNEATAMETYGMLAVNLYSSSGEVLNISKDAPAQIRFPVSTTTPNTPATIPLWYFDEAVGYWKEQGKATKVDGEFVAEVSHFTWWNCDLPIDIVNVCFELKNDVTLPGLYFEITRTQNNQLIYSGTTDSAGLHCGFFPNGEILAVSTFDSCNDQSPLSTQNIGPYDADTPNIIINITELSSGIAKTTLSATVTNCSDIIVSDGYVLVYNKSRSTEFDFEILPIINGEIEQEFTYCKGSEYAIIVKDLDSNEVSDVINFTAIEDGITSLGQLQTCEGNGGGVYEGTVTLQNQEEVDAFGLLGYSEIKGNLILSGQRFDDITSLSGLANLTAIEGDLKIMEYFKLSNLVGLNNITKIDGNFEIIHSSGTNRLNSLEGLENLKTIGGNLIIISGPTITNQITSLTGLGNLTSIGGNLEIKYNRLLTSLTGLGNLTVIGENLEIESNQITSYTGLENLTDIGKNLLIPYDRFLTSLVGLENLTTIGENLEISNSNLNSLKELENLTAIGGNLEINSNNIRSYTGLESLTTIGKNFVINSRFLASLTGLENLTSIGGNLEINNSKLNSIKEFENLTSIGGNLEIFGNTSLSSLTGLENLTSIGGNLEIRANSTTILGEENNFTSITGIDNLNTIGGNLIIEKNIYLISLTGIEKLSSVGGIIEISTNRGLGDFCGLITLFSNGSYGEVTILNNLYNPTTQDIIDGNCKE